MVFPDSQPTKMASGIAMKSLVSKEMPDSEDQILSVMSIGIDQVDKKRKIPRNSARFPFSIPDMSLGASIKQPVPEINVTINNSTRVIGSI